MRKKPSKKKSARKRTGYELLKGEKRLMTLRVECVRLNDGLNSVAADVYDGKKFIRRFTVTRT